MTSRTPSVSIASTMALLISSIELTDPDLTLRGLRIAAGHLGLEW